MSSVIGFAALWWWARAGRPERTHYFAAQTWRASQQAVLTTMGLSVWLLAVLSAQWQGTAHWAAFITVPEQLLFMFAVLVVLPWILKLVWRR